MLVTKQYNRQNALEYARRWAYGRNPLFFNFNGIGGDCTNFVSQCIFAGGCVMNYTPVFGWYYISSSDRAPAWTGVDYFFDFIVNNLDEGPYARIVQANEVEIGDVIQISNSEGDWYHSLIVVGFEPNDFLIAAHSDDSLDRPLSSYPYADVRYLHIEGIRVQVRLTDSCFDTLLSGGIARNENAPREAG